MNIYLKWVMKMRIDKTDKIDFELPEDFNLKFIEKKIILKVYKVRYTYKTNKGNPKENEKYLIADYEEQVKLDFIEYINNFNIEKPFRAISNVKILDVELMGTVEK